MSKYGMTGGERQGILAVSIVIIVIIGLFALSSGRYGTSKTGSDKKLYEEATEYAFAGDYSHAMQSIRAMKDKTYKETESLVALCEAERYLSNRDYENAWANYREAIFLWPSARQQTFLDKLKKDIQNIPIEEYAKRLEREEQDGTKDKLKDQLPYVGMAEHWIYLTSLGGRAVSALSADVNVRNGGNMHYYFYNENGLYTYDVEVDNREVVAVTDVSSQGRYHNAGTGTPHSGTEYPANEYNDVEEFVDDWGGYFSDDDAAYDYYYENQD